jgi:hypothetical protein
MISYHFYAGAKTRTDPNDFEAFFGQLDGFTTEVKQIEEIRKALSPQTRTTIDELGIILPDDNTPGAPQFPLVFWNAGGALYAYAWAKLSRFRIDVVGHSQLVGQCYILLCISWYFHFGFFNRLPRTTRSSTSTSIS